MSIQSGRHFHPWRPAGGQVFRDVVAIDTETTRIDDAHAWLTPACVLGAACDGERGVFINRDCLADFLHVHWGLPLIFHDAPFDLAVIHQHVPVKRTKRRSGKLFAALPDISFQCRLLVHLRHGVMRSSCEQSEAPRETGSSPTCAASNEFSDDFYRELHGIAADLMRRERPDCSIQATILVHDAFLAMQKQENLQGVGRSRRLAVPQKRFGGFLSTIARAKRRQKRGGNKLRKPLPPDAADVANPIDLLELSDAIEALRRHCTAGADIVSCLGILFVQDAALAERPAE